jgi:immunoglobulin-binding protein 1
MCTPLVVWNIANRFQYLSQNPSYLENDDSAIRDLHLANISLSTHNTFQALESMNRELEILSLAPPTTPPNPESLARDYRERKGIRGRDDDYSDRLDRPISELLGSNAGPILDKSGKPLRPFTLLDSRQRLADGVFKPGHNLPTMTIDEYLEEERRRGGIIEGGGEASGIAPEPDEDNYEKADQETMKAREWDEFVEANPKGSGNTLNRG